MESSSAGSTLNLARSKLAEAEQALQRIAARAVSRGEYDTVVLLTEWASALSRMSQQAAGPVGASPSQETHVVRAAAAERSPKQARSGKYPQFFREERSLVKVGWSKASKAEYEHKAPRTIVFSLVASVCRVAGRSSLITMEKLLPQFEQDRSEIPSYQLYLCLAWLRQLGLVRQHGRQGYSVKADIDLEAAAARAWEALPQRAKV